jgi:ketosteroid isomerase-like protein
MSRENVETVRTSWEAWMKGDVAALLGILDSEVVYEDDLLPDHAGETYRGVEGLVRAWSSWTEPWEDFESGLEWVRDAGHDVVVSCHWARMRGKGSGIPGEVTYAYVWRFEAGKVVYCKSFGEPSEALGAVGLSE